MNIVPSVSVQMQIHTLFTFLHTSQIFFATIYYNVFRNTIQCFHMNSLNTLFNITFENFFYITFFNKKKEVYFGPKQLFKSLNMEDWYTSCVQVCYFWLTLSINKIKYKYIWSYCSRARLPNHYICKKKHISVYFPSHCF